MGTFKKMKLIVKFLVLFVVVGFIEQVTALCPVTTGSVCYCDGYKGKRVTGTTSCFVRCEVNAKNSCCGARCSDSRTVVLSVTMPEKVLLDSYKARPLNIRVHNRYDGSPITNIEVGLYLASAQVTAAFVSSDVGKVEGGKWLIPSLASGQSGMLTVLVTANTNSTNGKYIASAKVLSTSDPITKESSERATTTDLLINIPAETTIKTDNTATTFTSESEYTTVRPIISTATVYIVGDDVNEIRSVLENSLHHDWELLEIEQNVDDNFFKVTVKATSAYWPTSTNFKAVLTEKLRDNGLRIIDQPAETSLSSTTIGSISKTSASPSSSTSSTKSTNTKETTENTENLKKVEASIVVLGASIEDVQNEVVKAIPGNWKVSEVRTTGNDRYRVTIETNSNEFENNDSFQESFEEKLKEADIDYVIDEDISAEKSVAMKLNQISLFLLSFIYIFQ